MPAENGLQQFFNSFTRMLESRRSEMSPTRFSLYKKGSTYQILYYIHGILSSTPGALRQKFPGRGALRFAGVAE